MDLFRIRPTPEALTRGVMTDSIRIAEGLEGAGFNPESSLEQNALQVIHGAESRFDTALQIDPETIEAYAQAFLTNYDSLIENGVADIGRRSGRRGFNPPIFETGDVATTPDGEVWEQYYDGKQWAWGRVS